MGGVKWSRSPLSVGEGDIFCATSKQPCTRRKNLLWSCSHVVAIINWLIFQTILRLLAETRTPRTYCFSQKKSVKKCFPYKKKICLFFLNVENRCFLFFPFTVKPKKHPLAELSNLWRLKVQETFLWTRLPSLLSPFKGSHLRHKDFVHGG